MKPLPRLYRSLIVGLFICLFVFLTGTTPRYPFRRGTPPEIPMSATVYLRLHAYTPIKETSPLRIGFHARMNDQITIYAEGALMHCNARNVKLQFELDDGINLLDSLSTFTTELKKEQSIIRQLNVSLSRNGTYKITLNFSASELYDIQVRKNGKDTIAVEKAGSITEQTSILFWVAADTILLFNSLTSLSNFKKSTEARFRDEWEMSRINDGKSSTAGNSGSSPYTHLQQELIKKYALFSFSPDSQHIETWLSDSTNGKQYQLRSNQDKEHLFAECKYMFSEIFRYDKMILVTKDTTKRNALLNDRNLLLERLKKLQ